MAGSAEALARRLRCRLQEKSVQANNGRSVFLSTLPASNRERSVALAVVGVSAILFACAVPFAGMPLTPVPAFVASYQSALAVNDLITAVLLFSQFGILRSRALLFLASGYLFTAPIALIHALTFPGLFAPTGLLGAGPQSTAWLFMIWHGGFPLFALAYALTKGRSTSEVPYAAASAIIASVVAVGALVTVITSLVTTHHELLPVLLNQGHYSPVYVALVTTVWCFSVAALLALLLMRPHSVLDVWLMVVLSAWLFDIALSAILHLARFHLGLYAR